MMSAEKIPRAATIILSLSVIVPLLATGFPHLTKFLLLDINFFVPVSMFTSIFLASFDLQLLITCLMRFQILYSIENINRDDTEILFYTVLFILPLFVSYFAEGLRSFHGSINMAYVYMLSQNQSEFNILGANVSHHVLPYIYLGIDFVLSNGQTKAYYGLLHGILYFRLKKYGLRVPKWFSRMYLDLYNRTTRPAVFKGKGRKVRG